MGAATPTPANSARRFVVLQPGARLHYAVPALLARKGRLARLYTDVHSRSTWPLASLSVVPIGWLPRPLARLSGRALPPELARLTTSLPWSTLTEMLAGALRSRGDLLAVPTVEAKLRALALSNGFNGATALYSLSNGDLDLIREAKERGLFVAYEQIINPHVGRILREERARHPGLEPQDSEEEVESGIRQDQAVWRLADVVLAASDFVRDEVCAHGISGARVHLVPYGIREDWLALPAEPVPGRILFVGSVGLRKGVHVLAAAARELRRRRVPCEIRVVGPIALASARKAWLAALGSREFEGVTYVGQVPRAQVREEFRRADVFALPTLAESFALVHLEAMAFGVPVLTTPNCGSTVRDGQDGYVVPIRDPMALAGRLQQIVEDRALRARLSANARVRAAEFTWDRYAERLFAALDAPSHA